MAASIQERGDPRILVVEDDAQQRRWLVTTLSSLGYRAEAAKGVRAALELLAGGSASGGAAR